MQPFPKFLEPVEPPVEVEEDDGLFPVERPETSPPLHP